MPDLEPTAQQLIIAMVFGHLLIITLSLAVFRLSNALQHTSPENAIQIMHGDKPADERTTAPLVGVGAMLLFFAVLTAMVLMFRYFDSMPTMLRYGLPFLASLTFTHVVLKSTGKVSGLTLDVVPIPIAALAAWLVNTFPNWLMYDLVFFMVCTTGLLLFPKVRLRYILWILLALMVYDIVSVYGTGHMMELATTVSEADNRGIPGIMLVTPLHMFDLSSTAFENRVFMLGAGDIVLSGYMIRYARSIGVQLHAILAFIIGLTLSLAVLLITGQGVPALMTLVPTILIVTLVSGRLKGTI